MNRPDLIGAWDGLIAAMQHIRDSGKAWPELKFVLPKAGALDEAMALSLGDSVSMKLTRDGRAIKVSINKLKVATIKLGRAPWWEDGMKHQEPAVKRQLWDLLRELSADPIAALSRRGKDLGWCCMCGLPLSNDESVALGMGPKCRARLGG